MTAPLMWKKFALRVILAACLFCSFTVVLAQEPVGSSSLSRTSIASTTSPTASSTLSAASSTPTADEHDHHDHEETYISCHMHGDTQYCDTADGEEVAVGTGCHNHGTQRFCTNSLGKEVPVPPLNETSPSPDHGNSTQGNSSQGGKKNCHTHAGVQHCDGDPESIIDPAKDCVVERRDYNKKFRIGAVFLVLVTSSICVFGPMLLSKLRAFSLTSLPFTIIKQFGTGVIISTALVHLSTHSALMFGNPCVGELPYESTGTAIIMAGVILAFLVEYIADRFRRSIEGRQPISQPEDGVGTDGAGKESETAPGSADSRSNEGGHHHHHSPILSHSEDKLSVLVMEAGIIFHSILIGVVLVVADDSAFTTLLIVIVFHQGFEGLALGTRIAAVPAKLLSLWERLLMCFAFAAITPIGMCIGIGVLNKFNGNDRETLLTLGSIDALSAGILLWVGCVEMLAADWVFEGGEMKRAGLVKTLVGGVSLMMGMILMSLLGKWT